LKLAICDENVTERASHKVAMGTKLFVKTVRTFLARENKKLFDWDPLTLPIIAERKSV